VWEENWVSVDMFLRCCTQWRVGGMGGVTGLDYAAVIQVIKLWEVDDPTSVLEDIQVMEATAMAILNKEKK
tara:strand:+ start:2057 stop:2269 length:213 start_codon:yes stop_codon:yes gene_type:complete